MPGQIRTIVDVEDQISLFNLNFHITVKNFPVKKLILFHV